MSFTLPGSRFSVRVQVPFAVQGAVSMFAVDTDVTKQLEPNVPAFAKRFGEAHRSLGVGGNTNREQRTSKSELKG